MMKKIYESKTIDNATGETLVWHTIKSIITKETFMSVRLTDGLEWINEFKTHQDHKLLMYILELENIKTGVVTLTSLQIDECAKFFNVTERTIRNSITSLIETKFIKRIAKNNYIINPYTYYKGGTNGFLKKQVLWNKYNSKNSIVYSCKDNPDGSCDIVKNV